MIEVDVHRRHDQTRMIMLQRRKQFLHMPFVVVVNERHRPRDLPAPALLPMLDELGPDHIGDRQRSIVVAFFRRHLVELAEKIGRKRNAEARGGFIFHRCYESD